AASRRGRQRLVGVGSRVGEEVEMRTGVETRVTMPGQGQRGRTPTAVDRTLATSVGIAANDAVHEGAFGQMVALQAAAIVRVTLDEAVSKLKTVDRSLYHDVAEVFFS